jgi:arsenate reductase
VHVTEKDELSIFYNPRCSKCRTAQGILTERGIDAHVVEYLKDAPTVPQLQELMEQLGLTDPRAMMRTGEGVYAELGLDDRSGTALLEAIAAHPILLERPIVVRGGRAVIARPPERLLELLEPSENSVLEI